MTLMVDVSAYSTCEFFMYDVWEHKGRVKTDYLAGIVLQYFAVCALQLRPVVLPYIILSVLT